MTLRTPSQLSARQLARIAGHAMLASDESLLLIYDATLFGAASSGLLVTDRRIIDYDKRDRTALAYDEIAALRIEHIGADRSGLSYDVHVVAASGLASIEITAYLTVAEVEAIVAAVQPRLATQVAVDFPSRAPVTGVDAPPARFSAAGRPVSCRHCGGDQFVAREVLLNTAAMTFVKLDWLEQAGSGLECAVCGLVAVFMKPPQLSA